MTEGLDAVLALPELPWIIAAAILAGVVRGFAGFGAGMIFITIVGALVDPITTVITLQIMDGIGALPLLPRAFREGEPRQVGVLTLAALFTLPVGIVFLESAGSDLFRWLISALILTLLTAMLLGLRYTKRLQAKGTVGVGLVAGFLSGFAGLSGPPVIMMYMSGPYRAETIRANIILFFAFVTVFMVLLVFWRGLLTPERVWLGLVLVIPYAIASLIGQRIFHPEREALFRAVAYIVIFSSVLLNLPLWR